ncbi:MAG: endonuclease/exonuclease/phosphatase family protein [Halofilum sp. (in: g-proteobacteria)]
MLEFIATGLVLLAAAATAAPMLRRRAWWIRAFDFPRGQITLLCLAGLALYAPVFRPQWPDLLVATIGLAAIARQGYLIFPYTRLSPTEVLTADAPKPEETLRLMVANVCTPNRRSGDLLRIVREVDPDVLLLLESDAWWGRQMAELEADYPWVVRQPQDNLYGMHLYSRLELVDPRIRFMVQDEIPSVHTEVVLRSGHRVEFYGVHPAPPSPNANAESTERDAELLLVGRAIRGGERSVIVTGDLNDVAWSRTTRRFRRIGRLLDPRVGRGLFNTFHARYWFLRWPLDHLFHSDDFTLVWISRLRYFGSDHFPIAITLHHNAAARKHQEPEETDVEDHSRARRVIRRAGIRPRR